MEWAELGEAELREREARARRKPWPAWCVLPSSGLSLAALCSLSSTCSAVPGHAGGIMGCPEVNICGMVSICPAVPDCANRDQHCGCIALDECGEASAMTCPMAEPAAAVAEGVGCSNNG